MKLASLEIIKNITPISGADKIELATIQGWQSVVKKGEYKVGDQVIFIPIDTILKPAEWNSFLWDKNEPSKSIRIKTIRLRGVISQGLVFPRSLINNDAIDEKSIPDLLGITKYEKPIHASLAGQVIGDFPGHILSKTDEDNLLSNSDVLDELKTAHTIIGTLKMDGTSATYIKELNGNFKVCSRNLELADSESNVHWNIARKYNLHERLAPGTAIQGEIVGPKINSNSAGFNEPTLFIFNFKDLATQRYKDVTSAEMQHTLKEIGVNTVPVLFRINNVEFKRDTIDSLQQYTNVLIYDNKTQAEGLVIRGVDEHGSYLFSKTLGKMLSVKLINQNYKE